MGSGRQFEKFVVVRAWWAFNRTQKMEVDQAAGASSASDSVLTSTTGSVSVSLHPLVIMNISDQFTRVRMQQEDATAASKSILINAHHIEILELKTLTLN